MPVLEVISAARVTGLGLCETLVVERIVLGYEMTPSGIPPTSREFTLVPAWLFYGRNAEGTVRFTVRLPVGETADGASLTVMPSRTPTPTVTPVGDAPDETSPAGDSYPSPVETEEAYPSP